MSTESRIALAGRVHGFAVYQAQPPLGYAVDAPDKGNRKYQVADQNRNQKGADNAPQKRIPERADLPAKMGLEPGSSRITNLDMGDDDSDQGGNTHKIPDGLQGIHHHSHGLERIDRKSTRLNSSHVKISYAV